MTHLYKNIFITFKFYLKNYKKYKKNNTKWIEEQNNIT